jgi:hypothetical protein
MIEQRRVAVSTLRDIIAILRSSRSLVEDNVARALVIARINDVIKRAGALSSNLDI